MPDFDPVCVPEADESGLSPLRFVGARDVIEDDAREVVDQATWSACNTPVHYCGALAAPPNFLHDANDQPQGDNVLFDGADDVWVERFENTVRIGKNVYEVELSARAYFAAGETGEIRILFNTLVLDTIALSDADNGTWVRSTIAVADIVSTTGSAGPYAVAIQIRRTAGGATNELITWSLDGKRRDPATLPAPSG